MFAGVTERPPGPDRCVLSHRHVFAGPQSDSGSRRTPSRARLGHRLLAAIVDALGHVTDYPDVAAELIIRLVLAERLHFAAVHTEIHVPHATTLPVISGVRVDHLDEVCVPAVQTINISRA